MYFILIEENIRVLLVSKSLELDLKAYILPLADLEGNPLENHKGLSKPREAIVQSRFSKETYSPVRVQLLPKRG